MPIRRCPNSLIAGSPRIASDRGRGVTGPLGKWSGRAEQCASRLIDGAAAFLVDLACAPFGGSLSLA
jgi:hypothetical protein